MPDAAAMSELVELVICCGGKEGDWTVDSLQPLLRMPSLRRLKVIDENVDGLTSSLEVALGHLFHFTCGRQSGEFTLNGVK